ncbi:hypothetical protein Amn_45210 [Aminobacter sp. Y103A]|nr:hypothetical protein Amn_45210 [Aminobacter sp. SS-2016]
MSVACVIRPIDYLPRRWQRFIAFPTAAGSAWRTCRQAGSRWLALDRKSWLIAGSEYGATQAAAMTTLITTAKAQRRRFDRLVGIATTSQILLHELLPWKLARKTRLLNAA